MTTDLTHEKDLQLLREAEAAGGLKKYKIYTRLSGPGWLQGAITLGGGSLAGSLYLGVIMGYNLMWLQPLAMIMGVIMLSAISYVTLSSRERPFDAIKYHISPALAWGWLLASMLANIVWCLPQFALGTAAIQQNLFPTADGFNGLLVSSIGLFVAATIVVWFYNSGNWGIRVFEYILKALVGIVVLSFIGVVVAMTIKGALPWGRIFAGFIPDPRYLFTPVPTMETHIASTGDSAGWWRKLIAGMQKDNIITAFATAVGINMTFLLPYSMLRKGWHKTHRGLAIFDLSIGLIVPFVLATGCVVIASASQFHGEADDVLQKVAEGNGKEVAAYEALVDERLLAIEGDSYKELLKEANDETSPARESAQLQVEAMRESLPESERHMAAMLAARDNLSLATTLAPLVGSQISQKVFGIGVLGMALSTIIILMLINGFAFCEMIGAPHDGPMHRVGSMIPALVGVFGPFYWSKAAAALAMPTSVIGGAMLPIAYISFLLLMNSRTALGAAMPTGAQRVRWNVLMLTATFVALFASAWGLYGKRLGTFPIGNVALLVLGVLLLVGIGAFFTKNRIKP